MKSRNYVDNITFVKTYMKCESRQEVAKTLKMPPKAVSLKAAYLRNLGIDLPKWNYRTSEAEIQELNNIVEEYMKQHGQTNGQVASESLPR